MAISYQPWYVGQTFPKWDIPLNTDAGADDITGVTIGNFSMIFRNTSVTPNVDVPGTGTFSLKTSSPAEVYYKPSPGDVAAAFSGVLIVEAFFPPSNSTDDKVVYDPIPFVITAD